jgi:hypothetical protein
MHSYLGEQELFQLSDNVGSSPPASTPYDQTKNSPPWRLTIKSSRRSPSMQLSTTTRDVVYVSSERLFALLAQFRLRPFSIATPFFSLRSQAPRAKNRISSRCHSAEVPDKYLQRFPSWPRSLRLSQQTLESIRFQLLKRLHNHIGVKILAFVAYPYAPHAGAARPLDSGAGVFHDNTPLGRNVDSGSG